MADQKWTYAFMDEVLLPGLKQFGPYEEWEEPIFRYPRPGRGMDGRFEEFLGEIASLMTRTHGDPTTAEDVRFRLSFAFANFEPLSIKGLLAPEKFLLWAMMSKVLSYKHGLLRNRDLAGMKCKTALAV